jgi:hypothetical protein
MGKLLIVLLPLLRRSFYHEMPDTSTLSGAPLGNAYDPANAPPP